VYADTKKKPADDFLKALTRRLASGVSASIGDAADGKGVMC
jgi:hypothetical protein